ncbi:PREDICTED: arginine/serine-rich coiled-coil protein 2-like isoform X1 [Rhagoletis zephyria]|uniref:arginine/serine-rich coiled-coil protein 2-like isoform X1 n=1 Tax=Rhagoletis zephyria TaxID=28612 RepID=UPI000811725F|nr:PREDICTED: arginine/serine-rich coiled-coil protein 2-like isoform X1 [Rhagoletis zephyria]XP_017488653.1 PREDICTED: arginine/serine-rich coiled-coil protein 2-like isoform X1 [Rhagoletis zephyria]XP_017488654.1 PREDICTED: arginine/serine-rich coiled-coil protein 2-like isoform X1 [Rhagoletis zephyria]XP_017488655.1 PREDICTED: arginine/serine-rich coiled-coil protein 2-like isoform X1 [Rhagoletis zephyria]
MSSMNQRLKRDMGFDNDSRREDRRRRSRSRSRSRQRRYRRKSNDSRSRSRSRSVEYRRRHVDRRTRSRSRSLNRRDRYNTSRRHRDSRSRTPTRSHRSNRRDSRSRSSDRKTRDGERRHNSNENKTSTSNSGSNNGSTTTQPQLENTDLQHLPLPKREPIGAYYNLDTDEPIDKERIHREMEEKLRQALAKEGKVYPPKKPEASHPVFANDGSFLEIFKKMQAQQNATPATVPSAVAPIPAAPLLASTSNAAAYIAATSTGKCAPPPPIVGRRRGGKILKTGVVAKQKAQAEQSEDPKDFWSLYLAEVNKYKNHACDSDGGTRPLVK